MSILDSIIAYEEGTLSADGTVDLFAELVRTGQAWHLQGSYGRAAADLIDRGFISTSGERTVGSFGDGDE